MRPAVSDRAGPAPDVLRMVLVVSECRVDLLKQPAGRRSVYGITTGTTDCFRWLALCANAASVANAARALSRELSCRSTGRCAKSQITRSRVWSLRPGPPARAGQQAALGQPTRVGLPVTCWPAPARLGGWPLAESHSHSWCGPRNAWGQRGWPRMHPSQPLQGHTAAAEPRQTPRTAPADTQPGAAAGSRPHSVTCMAPS
jgi:hypothetical protein